MLDSSDKEESFYYQYQLRKQIHWHNASKQRKIPEDISYMISSFEKYETLEHLRHLCYAISAQANLDEQFSSLITTSLQSLQNGAFENEFLIQAYYQIYLSFSVDNGEKYYQNFKKILASNEALFPKTDLTDLTLLAINFCIKQYNNGFPNFMKEIFFNYKLGLKNGSLLSENGSISRWTFQNIVSAGLLLNEIDWTEKFLRDFKDRINSTNKQSIYDYNLSKLFYKQKAFRKAILHLQKIDSKDVVEVLNARALLIRIYYEEKEWEALDSQLRSFDKYITRQKRIGYQKKAFLNLVRFTTRLLAIQNGSQKQLSTFKSRVQKTEPLANKQWLIEQLEQLSSPVRSET